MRGGEGSSRNQMTPRAERAERRAVFRQRQQRLQQLAEQKGSQVKAEQRGAQASAAAQLRRGRALQEARMQTVGAGLSAPQSEAQQQGSQKAAAAPAAASCSSAHRPHDSSNTATASAAAFASSALTSNPQQRPSDKHPASLQDPKPVSAAAAAAALRRSEPQLQAGVAAHGVVAQSMAVDESLEKARWRCFSRTPANSAAMAAGLSASRSTSNQLQCDHSGSGGISADATSSSSSGRNLTTNSNAATLSRGSSIARFTQRPSPVVIPPNSISLSYLHSFLSADECATLIELGAGNFSRSQVGFKAGAGHASSSRTSYDAVLSRGHPTVGQVRARVAELVGVRDSQIEALAVVRYVPGQQFLPHFDSHGDDSPRSHTIFAYLNDLPDGAGGETEFTRIGVKFKPKKGDALFWENRADRHSYHLDGKHAGRPPLSGVKYGLNIWIQFDDVK